MIALLLLHVGLGATQPVIPPEHQVGVALSAYGRGVAAALPGADVPL